MHARTLRIAALAAVLLPSALLADTPALIQWVVTSAKATGAGGAQFVTSLRILNPNAAAAPVSMYLLPQSPLDGGNNALGDNSAAVPVSISVPPNSTLAIDDVLGTEFSTQGAGGIRIVATGVDSSGRPLAVWVLSQTLVVNALSSTGVPGTNGFAIPSQSQDQLVAVGETAYVPYISASPTSTSGYRTNLFLLSANGAATTGVTVTLRKSDGTTIGSKNITLGKFSQTQINNIASFFGYTPTGSETNLTAIVNVSSGGPIATGASIIDNAISSISYSPPVKVPVANNGAYGLILGDGGFDFSGRAEIVGGAWDVFTASIVIPGVSCSGVDTLFSFQAFGPPNANATFTLNSDGSTSFAGTQAPDNATFSGVLLTNFDGSVYGNVTYTRPGSGAANTCPGASITYSFAGAKGLDLTP